MTATATAELSTPQLVRAYERDGLSIMQLAALTSRSGKWVSRRLHDGGATMRPARRRRTHVIDPDQAQAAYREHGTVQAAAAAAAVPEPALTDALKSAGVTLANRGRARDEWPVERVEAELRAHLSDHPAQNGFFPTTRELRDAGRRALIRGIEQTGGSARWADTLGLTVRRAGRRPAAR